MKPQNVSVVVCTHNSELWIEQAISSVAAQTFDVERVQTILVDSQSSDRTVSKARAVAAAANVNLQIVVRPNAGPSHARNTGWGLATGDWIQFLDGDDVLHPSKIELQMDVAKSLGGNVSVVYSDWRRFNSETGHSVLIGGTLQSPRIGTDPLLDLLRPGNFVHVGSQLIRRASLELVSGFDERHWLLEDVDLLFRLAMSGAVFTRVVSEEPLFSYRQRAGSLSRRSHQEFVEACLRNTAMVEAYWRSTGDLTPERRELLAELYLQGARYYASRDAGRFEATTSAMELLVPGFVPRSPLRLRYASQFLGYRRAEALATLYRSFKRK